MAVSGSLDKLSSQQIKAIAALLTVSEIADAARQSGIAERTLYRWLRSPDFQAALKDAQRQAVEAAVRRLSGASGKALDVLDEVMGSTSATDGVKVRAALGVIDSLIKLSTFVSFEDRLANLEERLEGLTPTQYRQGSPTIWSGFGQGREEVMTDG